MSAAKGYIRKLWRSDEERPSRFHTQDGRCVGIRGWLEFPVSAISYVLLKAGGFRFVIPWWTWGAIRFVKRRINTKDTVLEDGSGMSTLWLARRCEGVLSIEQSSAWRKEVESRAAAMGLQNIRLLLGESSLLFPQYAVGGEYTVVVIDGPGDRLGLLEFVITLNRLPDIIVYDNSDRPQICDGKELVKELGYEVRSFRGFAPGLVNASETSVFLLRRN